MRLALAHADKSCVAARYVAICLVLWIGCLLGNSGAKASEPIPALVPNPAAIHELPPVVPAEQPVSQAPESIELGPTLSPPAGVADSENLRTKILLRAARNAVSLKNFPEALSRFRTLLQEVPFCYEGRFEYSGLLIQTNRLPEARQQLEILVAQQAQQGAYRLALADVLLMLKDYRAASVQLRALLPDPEYGRRAAIKLARALVQEQRLDEARQFYNARLQNLGPLNQSDTLELARLLIDLERPGEALNLLIPQLAAHPAVEPLIALVLSAQVRANERLAALELIERLDKQPLQDAGVWLKLASQFYEEQAYPEALAVFQKILRSDPNEKIAELGIARSHLQLFQVDLAKTELEACRGVLDDKAYSTVMADYHIVVGEYAEAIAIGKQRIAADPNDLQALVILGDAYHASRQFRYAETAYNAALSRLAPAEVKERRELLRLQAKNYSLSRKFDSALVLLNGLLEQQPSDVGCRILLIEVLIEMRRWDEALAVASAPGIIFNPRSQVALDTQRGYVLLKRGCWAEAFDQFGSLASDPNGRLPDVAYGLYHASSMLGRAEEARESLGYGPTPLAPMSWWSLIISGRAMSFCDCQLAAQVLNAALSQAPGNVLLLVQRGEAAQLCNGSCRREDCESYAADQIFYSALQTSPTNIRAHLGRARSFSKHLEYEEAYAEYCTLLGQIPADPNVIRETAHMVEAWKDLETASTIYSAGENIVAEEDLYVASLVGPTQGLSDQPEDISPAFSASGIALVPTVQAPPARLLANDFQSRYLRGWRDHQAICASERLLASEPTNDSAMFDLAQSQSALNRTHCAIDTYQRLLDMNPCHRDAATALARNRAELGTKINSSFDYSQQLGRQGLANMTWLNYTMSARHNLGDENEYFEWGYRERILKPTDDRHDLGEIPFFRWQQKYSEDSVLFVDLAVEKYQYGLRTRPTFNAGFNVVTKNDSEFRASAFLKNYYVCGEAVRQDIYTSGFQFDGIVRPKPWWTFSGYYRTAYYSDDNWVNWFNLNSSHMILEGRRQLRAIVDYNFYSFAQQTIFGPIPGSLVGTIHPYWSPKGYSVLTVGPEWKHWLSCDAFKGGNEQFYSVFIGGAVDSKAAGYFLCNAHYRQDFSPRVSWTVDANLCRTHDVIYNAVGVATYLVVRFP